MKKIQKKYDVIVAGGGTAGCSAAYNAAKLGLKTLLIEKNMYLGGTMTASLVIPAMYSSDNQINTSFFNDLIAELRILKGQITYQHNKGWFNPELCKIALDRLMSKAGVEVLFDTIVTATNTTNKRIEGVSISLNLLSVYIVATNLIDATGNCEIGKLAGCKFVNKKNEFQPVSLRFEMSGVDLKTFSKWLLDFDKDRTVSSSEDIEGKIHLSTAYTWDSDKKWALAPLFDDAVEKNILKNEDRNYFQVFSIPNMSSSIAFNCPRILLDTINDPLDNIFLSKALVEGRESIIRIAEFCKLYFPGFEKSYISNIADAIGIRVSRRIKGKYVYTVEDLTSGKKFKNPVLISSYPIDIHSSKKNKSVLKKTVEYQLPIEALISDDYDNLFVVGRCLSADFHAQAALRIQPSCFSMGEGVAKYIANLYI